MFLTKRLMEGATELPLATKFENFATKCDGKLSAILDIFPTGGYGNLWRDT